MENIVEGSRGNCDGLQELFTPVVEALVAVGRLLAVGADGVLHPLLEQLGVFLENQVLAENRVCLENEDKYVPEVHRSELTLSNPLSVSRFPRVSPIPASSKQTFQN